MGETSDSASAAPAPRRRGPGRPFAKGVSPNPGGLPRGVAGAIMRARRLALKYAPAAIQTLADLLGHDDARVRVAAAEGLLDRAGLRPFALEPERHEVAVATVNVDALRDSLASRLAGLAARVQVVEVQPVPTLAEAPQAHALPAGDASGVGACSEAGAADCARPEGSAAARVADGKDTRSTGTPSEERTS